LGEAFRAGAELEVEAVQLHAAVLEQAAQLAARLLEGVEAGLVVGGDRGDEALARGAQMDIDLPERLGLELQGRAGVAGAGRRDADELLDALGGLDDGAAGELRRAGPDPDPPRVLRGRGRLALGDGRHRRLGDRRGLHGRRGRRGGRRRGRRRCRCRCRRRRRRRRVGGRQRRRRRQVALRRAVLVEGLAFAAGVRAGLGVEQLGGDLQLGRRRAVGDRGRRGVDGLGVGGEQRERLRVGGRTGLAGDRRRQHAGLRRRRRGAGANQRDRGRRRGGLRGGHGGVGRKRGGHVARHRGGRRRIGGDGRRRLLQGLSGRSRIVDFR
jgi:hypothetical protein